MRLFAGTEFDIPPTCERCAKLEQIPRRSSAIEAN